MKKTILMGLLTLFLIFAIGSVSADLIPNTAPCWVKGTVTSTDFTADDLTVNAYLGTTLLKSSSVSSGDYSMNSVGANDGDTISLKVYGHEFTTFTFAGYCKTGSDPWVVEDFTVSKQANGQECDDNAICTSGYCSDGVCATQSSGRRHPHDNTYTSSTTTTTVSTTTTTISYGSGAQALHIIDTIRSYYSGGSGDDGTPLSPFDILDMIRNYYGG